VKDPLPRTKKWFEEDSNRLKYLNKDTISTFKKFGSNIAMAILEGTRNIESLKEFYINLFAKITRENERSTILQL
jgi:hypothetical protein